MKVETIIEELQYIKAKYPSLSNDEILKIQGIKTLTDIKERINNGR